MHPSVASRLQCQHESAALLNMSFLSWPVEVCLTSSRVTTVYEWLFMVLICISNYLHSLTPNRCNKIMVQLLYKVQLKHYLRNAVYTKVCTCFCHSLWRTLLVIFISFAFKWMSCRVVKMNWIGHHSMSPSYTHYLLKALVHFRVAVASGRAETLRPPWIRSFSQTSWEI